MFAVETDAAHQFWLTTQRYAPSMPGMSVVVASTCVWEHFDPDVSPPLQGEVLVGQSFNDDERFEARFRPTTLPWPRERSDERSLYVGSSLEECVAALNKGVADLRDEGFSPDADDQRPQHFEASEIEPELDSARKLIADHLADLPPQPPAPIAVGIYQRVEIENAVELLSIPRGSVFAGDLGDRPVIFTTDTSMTGWIDPREDVDLQPGEAKAFVFDDPKTRWVHIVRQGWDRRRPGYLREEMRARFELLVPGGTPDQFDNAYASAELAIQSLPCGRCHQIDWPVIGHPEWGSAEWWDDPKARFVCEHCGGFLGLLGQPRGSYPFKGLQADGR